MPLPWLPPAQDGEIERAATSFASRWAADWFTPPCGVRVRTHAGGAGEDFHWSGPSGAAVGVASAARARLGLSLVAGQADLDNPQDRAVMEALADAAVSDLAKRFGVLDGADGVSRGASVVLRLSLDDDRWFLLLSLDGARQTVLRQLAAGQRERPTLARLAEALAPEPVTIGCHIGHATLTASEVAGLAAGDLVSLDRRVTDDLPVTLGNAIAARGKARVVREEAGVVVRIAQAIDLNQ